MKAIADTAVTTRGGAAGVAASPADQQPGKAEAVGKPSAEIRELMTRLYDAMSQGSVAGLDRLLSRRTGLLWIGTDPSEWWKNPEAALQAWQEQTAALGGQLAITGSNATAHQHGDVAWVADAPAFHLPDGRSFPFRLTAVWVREPEGWRIVQVHTSLGVANESVLRSA